MFKTRSIALMAASIIGSTFLASAQDVANGSVLEYSGAEGELIVSRGGIVYSLSAGDELFYEDVLRAQKSDTATVSFNGCTWTLPEGLDVKLDDGFCVASAEAAPSMAMLESQGLRMADGNLVSGAPFILGGTVLAAGGLVDAVNGGDGGTGSSASTDAGAIQGTGSSPTGGT